MKKYKIKIISQSDLDKLERIKNFLVKYKSEMQDQIPKSKIMIKSALKNQGG